MSGMKDIVVHPSQFGSMYNRIPDLSFYDPMEGFNWIDEVKAGTGGNGRISNLIQAGKDIDIRDCETNNIQMIVWDFYPGRNGWTGPSNRLGIFLENNGIYVNIHVAKNGSENSRIQHAVSNFPAPIPTNASEPTLIPDPIPIPEPEPLLF
jgi:hypothetical protein